MQIHLSVVRIYYIFIEANFKMDDFLAGVTIHRPFIILYYGRGHEILWWVSH